MTALDLDLDLIKARAANGIYDPEGVATLVAEVERLQASRRAIREFVNRRYDESITTKVVGKAHIDAEPYGRHYFAEVKAFLRNLESSDLGSAGGEL